MNNKLKNKVEVKPPSPNGAFQIVTYLQAVELSTTFTKCSSVGLSVESFIKFIELMSCVETMAASRNKALKFLMNGYGILKPQFEGAHLVWPYKKHEKKDEIKLKLDAINGQVGELSPCNFISKEEYHAFVVNNGAVLATMGIASSLAKILMKKS